MPEGEYVKQKCLFGLQIFIGQLFSLFIVQ